MGRTDSSLTDTRPLKSTAVTDPAINAAVSTDILDTYSGVIITTTTTGNAQTLQTPTNTEEIKRFSVIIDDASTDAVTVNGTSLSAGEVAYFIWDGSAWAADAGGGGGAVTSVFSRTGAVVAVSGDYDVTEVTNAAADGANTDITSLQNTGLYVGRDTDNRLNWGTDDQLDIVIGGSTTSIDSISTGAADNDKLVTQGYIDDTFVDRAAWLQNGIVDKGDSTLAFNDGTRVFTINRTGSSFDYYVQGVKYTVTTDDVAGVNTVTLTDTEGMWAIYYDGATLTSLNNPSHSQYEDVMMTKCIVALVYYDATNNVGILYEERHGTTMAPWTHRYLHETIGMAYTGGLALGDFVISDGDDNEDAQFSIASGECYDEDNAIDLNAINSTTGNIIFYRVGSDWRWTTQTGFKCITFDGTSSTRLAYDNAGTLTEVSNNDFVLIHIFATNSYDGNCISILGQNEYGTLNAARNGAETEISNLVLGTLPSKEMKPIATVIYQTSNGYDNDVQGRVRETGTGDNYLDWRTTPLSAGVSAADHGALGGLGDDDHTQYALLAGRSGGQAYIGGTDASDDLTLDSTSNATKGLVKVGGGVLNVDETNTGLGINTEDTTINISGTPLQSSIKINQEGDLVPICSEYYSNLAFFAPVFISARGRGTASSPLAVLDESVLGNFVFAGYDGTNFEQAVQIFAEVDGTPGNNDMPGKLVFATTPPGSATPVERLEIGSSGTSTFSGKISTLTPTTATAGLNLPDGADPSSPAEGDLWYNGTNLYFRDSSSSVDLLAAGGISWGDSITYDSATDGLTIDINAQTNTISALKLIADGNNSGQRAIEIDIGNTGFSKYAIEISGQSGSGLKINHANSDGVLVSSLDDSGSNYGFRVQNVNDSYSINYGFYIDSIGGLTYGSAPYSVGFAIADLVGTRSQLFDFTANFTTSSSLYDRTIDLGVIDYTFSRSASTTYDDDYNLVSYKRTTVSTGSSTVINSDGSVLKLENVVTETAGTLNDSVNVLEIVQDADSTGAPLKITQAAVVSTNFKFVKEEAGVTTWVSDGTTPNGNLTGTQGDTCKNGPSGQPFYCGGGTTWTGM